MTLFGHSVSPHVLLFVWALLAVGGLVVCLTALMKPKTNQTCVFGLIIFLSSWLVECLAHSLVALLNFSSVFLFWGVSISSVGFAAGFVTASIGVLIHVKNEHRYKRGFAFGALAAALNGWIIAQAGAAWLNGQFEDLARGMVVRIIASDRPVLAGHSPKETPDSSDTDEVLASEAAARLSKSLLAFLGADADSPWRLITVSKGSPVAKVHPQSQAVLFSPKGPSWMSLSLERRADASASLLPEISEAAVARVVRQAATSSRRGANRLVVSGFEASRIRYQAMLPSLPGPHAFDHWTATGDGWIIEVVLWSPSSGAARFERQAQEVVSTMMRIASEQGYAKARRQPQVETLFQNAVAQWARGKTAVALSLWEQAAQQAPADAEIALSLAQAHDHLKNPAAALGLLESRSLLLSPSDVVTAACAHLRMRVGRPEALPELRTLITSGYSDDVAFSDYLSLLAAAQDWPTAAEALKKFGPRHGASLVAEWSRRLASAAAPAQKEAMLSPRHRPTSLQESPGGLPQ